MLRLALVVALSGVAVVPAAGADGPPKLDLTELSLAELADVEVTALSRRPQRQEDVPAAVHVVTGQDVRRLGTTTLPQALRLAPGAQVAQVDGNKTAFGIRGFADRLSRAVLVLVDGRSVYDTLYAGTPWETQDLVLDDIDRIEVIRGPGGALWGANAVNGIVNVITRPAADTQGGLLRLRLGNDDRQFTGRWGGAQGDAFHYRVWTKLFDRDGGRNDATPGFDSWRAARLGARADWSRGPRDTFTVDGAAYRSEVGQVVPLLALEPPAQVSALDQARLDGGHVLARWRRNHRAGETLVSGFFDATVRDEAHFDEDRRTLDAEATHVRRLGGRHQVVAGAGVRRADVDTRGTDGASFQPADRVDTIVSAFLQDEVRLAGERLRLTAGLKLERNPYSAWELQPSLRALARLGARHAVWASFSRAVRTPSRTERDVALTSLVDAPSRTFTRIVGSDTFMSEVVRAYEAGWRAELLGDRVRLDASAFVNRYDHLLGLAPGTPFTEGVPPRTVIPVGIGNLMEGRSHGLELAAAARARAGSGVQASWSWLVLDLEPVAPGGDRSLEPVEGYGPRQRFHVMGWVALARHLEVSAALRHHSPLRGLGVDAYTELDARVAWMRGRHELAVVGRNLLHADHVEWRGGPAGTTAIPRAFFAQASLRF